MTPDQIKLFFDGNAIIIMFVWGLLCKYVPWLAKVPNGTIPWVNAIGYILARLAGQLFAPAAEAATQQTADTVFTVGGVILGAFTSAVWARQLYEGFGRWLIGSVLGVRKAEAR